MYHFFDLFPELRAIIRSNLDVRSRIGLQQTCLQTWKDDPGCYCPFPVDEASFAAALLYTTDTTYAECKDWLAPLYCAMIDSGLPPRDKYTFIISAEPTWRINVTLEMIRNRWHQAHGFSVHREIFVFSDQLGRFPRLRVEVSISSYAPALVTQSWLSHRIEENTFYRYVLDPTLPSPLKDPYFMAMSVAGELVEKINSH